MLNIHHIIIVSIKNWNWKKNTFDFICLKDAITPAFVGTLTHFRPWPYISEIFVEYFVETMCRCEVLITKLPTHCSELITDCSTSQHYLSGTPLIYWTVYIINLCIWRSKKVIDETKWDLELVIIVTNSLYACHLSCR